MEKKIIKCQPFYSICTGNAYGISSDDHSAPQWLYACFSQHFTSDKRYKYDNLLQNNRYSYSNNTQIFGMLFGQGLFFFEKDHVKMIVAPGPNCYLGISNIQLHRPIVLWPLIVLVCHSTYVCKYVLYSMLNLIGHGMWKVFITFVYTYML